MFRLHRRPIQLVVFVPVGLSSLDQRSNAQVHRQKQFRHPTRPAEDVNKLAKGLQERTQLIEWDDGET